LFSKTFEGLVSDCSLNGGSKVEKRTVLRILDKPGKKKGMNVQKRGRCQGELGGRTKWKVLKRSVQEKKGPKNGKLPPSTAQSSSNKERREIRSSEDWHCPLKKPQENFCKAVSNQTTKVRGKRGGLLYFLLDTPIAAKKRKKQRRINEKDIFTGPERLRGNKRSKRENYQVVGDVRESSQWGKAC